MQNLPKPDDEGNDDANPLATIIVAAIATLDCRLTSGGVIALAARSGVCEPALIEMERAEGAIETLDDGASALVMSCMHADQSANLAGLAECARGFALTASRYFAVIASPHWVNARSGEPPGPLDPSLHPTDDDRANVARAHRIAGAMEPVRRRLAVRGASPAPTVESSKRERGAWFQDVVTRGSDCISDCKVRVALCFLSVASVAQWGPGARLGASLYDDAFPAMLARATPDDDGATLVRRALEALGHRPDDFAAADRVARNRAAKATTLARWRERAPEAFRAKVRQAVQHGGGVNSGAAKALGVTVAALREVIAGDPVLASELDVVNDAPAARRPKAG